MVCIIVDVAVLGELLAVVAGKLALGERGLCIRRRGVAVADKGRIRPADEPSLGIHHDAALILLDLKVEVLVFEVIVVDNVALLINWKVSDRINPRFYLQASLQSLHTFSTAGSPSLERPGK